MATYAEVINDSGKISIDDSTSRLCRKRTLALSPGYYDWGQSYAITNMPDYTAYSFSVYDVTLDSDELFIAVRAKAGHDNVSVFASGISAGLFRVYLLGTLNTPDTHAGDYLIDTYGYTPNRSYNSGLQIFNSASTKIFDSNEFYMGVAGNYKNDSTNLLWQSIQSGFPTSISIGSGLSLQNNSIVIGSNARVFARDHRYSTPAPCQGLYGIRFSSSGAIDLVLRCSTLTWSDKDWLPPNVTGLNTGIIMNHSNITARNDGTLPLISE